MSGIDVLFVNGCIRGREVSRTYRLARAYLDRLTKVREARVEELTLAETALAPLLSPEIEKRDRLLREGRYDDPMFRRARQFAAAEHIVLAAPFWDLSFPSVVKVYVEQLCVQGLTFRYTETGPEGLCRFRHFTYLTTCGGYAGENDAGTAYLRAVADFLGKGSFQRFSAEGLDIDGSDPEAILQKAIESITI